MSTSSYIATPKTVEDWLLFLTPIVAALAGFNWGGLVPGATGFVVGVALASLAKTLIGLGQNPHPSNWEDWLSFGITFLGFLATGLSANPSFLTYGVIIGLFVKALGFIQSGLNIEDVILAVGAFIAGYGQLTGNPTLLNAGLVLAIVGKAMPSIGTNGSPSTLRVSLASSSGTPSGTG